VLQPKHALLMQPNVSPVSSTVCCTVVAFSFLPLSAVTVAWVTTVSSRISTLRLLLHYIGRKADQPPFFLTQAAEGLICFSRPPPLAGHAEGLSCEPLTIAQMAPNARKQAMRHRSSRKAQHHTAILIYILLESLVSTGPAACRCTGMSEVSVLE
jgi:hypothetical protein